MSNRGLWAIAAVTILLVGYYVLFGASTQQTATAPEPEGPAIVAVSVPADFGSQAQLGLAAYTAKCAECHGPNAEGQKGVAPPLVHNIYEPGHHGDMSFVLAAQNGVRAHHWQFGDMPPVEGLTRGDVLNIVTYVRELQRENGIN